MADVTSLVATGLTTNILGPYTSGAFAPPIGELLVVGVACPGTTDLTGTLIESAGGGAYTLVEYKEWAGTGNGLYVLIRNTLTEAATSRTVSFTLPVDAATGCSIEVVSVSGVTRAGASAKRQTAENKAGAGGALTLTYGVACLTGNPTINFLFSGDNPPTLTVPTNWTTISTGSGFATPTQGSQISKRASGFTGTAVAWGGTSTAAAGAISLEVDSSAAAADAITSRNVRTVIRQSVQRAVTRMVADEDHLEKRVSGIAVPRLWLPEGAAA